MEYKLDTSIKFVIAFTNEKKEEIQTMEELGFTQEDLDRKSIEEIEKDLQEMYDDWKHNYLDAGWSVL